MNKKEETVGAGGGKKRKEVVPGSDRILQPTGALRIPPGESTSLRTTYIKLFAQIDKPTIDRLMTVIEQGLKASMQRFVLLISSPGGNVFAGISAFNFLRGVPAEILTHNFGSADSIATVIYCAGTRRYCVPHARFLLHGIGADLKSSRVDERLLDEQIQSLRADRENLSHIIAEACQQPLERVEHDILQGIVLSAQQAVAYGLVHEIRSQLVEPGAHFIALS